MLATPIVIHREQARSYRLCVWLGLWWLFASAWGYAQDLGAPTKELEELRGRIQALERALTKSEDRRDNALEEAKRSSLAIDATERELKQLASQRGAVNAELAQLQTQRAATQTRVKAAQGRIAKLYYQNYVHGSTTPLIGRVLSGENPNETGRQLQYSSYLARSQAAVVDALRADLDELKQLRASANRKGDQLLALTREEKSKHAQLLAQHDEQKRRVASLEARIDQQKDSIDEARRDEAKLSQLIARLTKQIEAKKKRAEERRRKAAEARKKREKAARVARAKGLPEPPPTRVEIEEPAEVVRGEFGRLRGRLARPVAGELVHRFGSPRKEGGISWKGVFYRAPAGAAVKAVAAGEVVFADWMRGFGQLLIIDHGDGYMSLYGNNEALRKGPGDAVRQGDTIASVGASGSNLETGLYFELRFRSRVINPLSWLSN